MATIKLSFFAREGLAYDRTRPRRVGQEPGYIGREKRVVDGRVSWPAMSTPYVMTLDLGDRLGNDLAYRVLPDLCTHDLRNGNPAALWPADAETAAWCGVPFVKVEHRDGEWAAKDPEPLAKKKNPTT